MGGVLRAALAPAPGGARDAGDGRTAAVAVAPD
jgi:hypothetical protein